MVDVGWGGVGHVNVRLHLRLEVDASCLMWGGVGRGMLTFACTCVTKLKLRCGCGVGWGGLGHINVRLHLRHEVDASWLMWGGVGWGGAKSVDQYVRSFQFRWNNRGNLLEALARTWPQV